MHEPAATKLPKVVTPGTTTRIGQHKFLGNEIIEYARKFDPQHFHTDPEAAKNSLFGGLCASGWHTVSIWMKLHRHSMAKQCEILKAAGEPYPEFGPSPGMKHLKWIRPVYENDTVSFTETVTAVRASNSKLGWHILQYDTKGLNQDGKPVISFGSAVFIKIIDQY